MGDIVHAGIDQHHRIDAVEEAFAMQDVLAAATFLARRAKRDDVAADLAISIARWGDEHRTTSNSDSTPSIVSRVV